MPVTAADASLDDAHYVCIRGRRCRTAAAAVVVDKCLLIERERRPCVYSMFSRTTTAHTTDRANFRTILYTPRCTYIKFFRSGEWGVSDNRRFRFRSPPPPVVSNTVKYYARFSGSCHSYCLCVVRPCQLYTYLKKGGMDGRTGAGCSTKA